MFRDFWFMGGKMKIYEIQNRTPQAVGFYEHMAFKTYKRTDLDEEGNPYPLLYMKLMR